MTTLLKKQGVHSNMQYYELIVLNMKKGQLGTAHQLYRDLSPTNRKVFLNAILFSWNCGLTDVQKKAFVDWIV